MASGYVAAALALAAPLPSLLAWANACMCGLRAGAYASVVKFRVGGPQRALREGDAKRPRRVERPSKRREQPDEGVVGVRPPPRHPLWVPAVRWVLNGPGG
eukprot:459594-Pleurochrysis_carterae.AAC.1